MAFTSRRGRPRLHRPKKDLGTRELQQKRAEGITSETLDICLSRNLISEAEHAAALRFRWLYTLHFGVPSLSAYHPDNHGKSLSRYLENAWMGRRWREYMAAITALKAQGTLDIIVNSCILGIRPRFLLKDNAAGLATQMQRASLLHQEFTRFKEGMELLERFRFSRALGARGEEGVSVHRSTCAPPRPKCDNAHD